MALNMDWLEGAGKLKQDLESRLKELNAAPAVMKLVENLTREANRMGNELQGHVNTFHSSLQRTDEQRTRTYPQMTYVKAPAFGAIIPGDSAVEAVLASGFLNFLNLYNSALIIRLVLTWFPNPPEVIVNPLSTICDPYLNLFRGIIPPIGGGLDFSPILAFLVLNVFTNTAAALPAELPVEEEDQQAAVPAPQNPWGWIQPSEREQLWAKLTAGRKMQQQQNQD